MLRAEFREKKIDQIIIVFFFIRILFIIQFTVDVLESYKTNEVSKCIIMHGVEWCDSRRIHHFTAW